MSMKPLRVVVAFALTIMILDASRARAQDTGKTKDDALESLIKELAEPEKAAAKPEKAAAKPDKPGKGKTEAPKSGASAPKPKQTSGTSATADQAGKPSGAKPAAPKSPDAGKVSAKDQALDELLGKLGETKDEPTADDHPPKGGGQGEEPQPPGGGQKPGAEKLGKMDKDLDERLEELTGRRKKRPSSDQERTGPVGEMIKEMRDVEQRLGKPDPSEATQKKQKEIVKRIETMIEQAKQSGSSMGKLTMRRVRQAGQQPGQQPGDQPGAMARGAPPMKPAKPTSQHSTANGKDIWGHLPDELRQIMDNSFKETALDSKRELISRYFLSVGKGKLVREE